MKYVDPVVTLFGREPVATLRTRLHALLSPMPISVESGTGTAIVDKLLRGGIGEIERNWNESGFSAVVRLGKFVQCASR